MIPLVNPATGRKPAAIQPWLGGPLRWLVVLLALVATVDAGYLTWKSFTQGAVAGCNGESSGCDEVLASRWSRVAGVPVALGGLLCYGTILGLALCSGSRTFNENAWLGTALVIAALLALMAGTWFSGLQLLAIGKLCYYCLAIHLCGMITALVVIWAAIQGRSNTAATSRSQSAITAALPGARRVAGPRPAERPSLLAAAPVAVIAMALLIAVQVMFPTQMYQVSTPELAAMVDMTVADGSTSNPDNELSPTAHEHVVNRVADVETAEPIHAEDADGAGETSPRHDDDVELASAEEDSESASAKDESVEEVAPKLSREVSFLKGRMKLDMYNEAVLGSPDAEYVVVELMDYTCPHCRKMHEHIREARNRYGDQLAVVILPMPLELECNKGVRVTDPSHRGSCKISKTALAVAKADPRKFLDFHNFLLQDEDNPPSSSTAVMRAFRVVDRTKFAKVSRDKELDERLQRYIRLYTALSNQHRGPKQFGLPVQIVGDTVLSGGDMTAEEMFEAWEKAIDIKPLE